MGKSWANHQGVARARGDWLLFTDADTWHHPNALSSAIQYMQAAKGDAMTLLPLLICLSFWEKVVQPAMIFSIAGAFSLDRLEDPERPEAIFNGQYILVGRETYTRCGGHEAIRASVADDLSLAERVKAAGGVIRYPIGTDLMKVRMYATLGEIWKGWSKNLFAGARGDVVKGVAGIVLVPIVHVLPWVALPYFAWVTAASGGWLPTLGAGLAGLVVALTIWARGMGLREYSSLSPVWALSHPLAFVVIWLIFINSFWRGVSGKGPEWKGRTYPGMHT
jgi:chlorobactene glucosyltransferase